MKKTDFRLARAAWSVRSDSTLTCTYLLLDLGRELLPNDLGALLEDLGAFELALPLFERRGFDASPASLRSPDAA